MKAMFRRLFKKSSKDKVAIVDNSTNNIEQEGSNNNINSRNPTGSPSKRITPSQFPLKNPTELTASNFCQAFVVMCV